MILSGSRGSPIIRDAPRAGVKLRPLAELAIELGRQRPVLRQAPFQARRDESLIRRRAGAIDHETRRRQADEARLDRGIALPIMRPGQPTEQFERIAARQRDRLICPSAELETRLRRALRVVIQRERARAVGCTLGISRRLEGLDLQRHIGCQRQRGQRDVIAAFQAPAIALRIEIGAIGIAAWQRYGALGCHRVVADAALVLAREARDRAAMTPVAPAHLSDQTFRL
jgi:hypothetical protein